MAIAKVEPITTARALRGPFDYRVPQGGPAISVGALLVVPFGNRQILGVVTALAKGSELPDSRLAEPEEVLDASTTPELLDLARWIAKRYASTFSRGIALALPPGAGTGKRPRSAKPRIERRASLSESGAELLAEGDDSEAGARLGKRQRAVLVELDRAGELATPELSRRTGAGSSVVKRLAEKGWVTISRVKVRRRPELTAVGDPHEPPTLSASQSAAAEAVIAALDGAAGSEREHLLFGVTGSGKTEVYLAAIEAALARGRSAILLVPEIGLTPQTLGRVAARLGDTVAVLHSGLSEGERFDEWMRLRSGEARVCVGPRSAIFAPLGDLGLVVVDEEHDASYKQEGDPRYDTRAVARRRAEAAGAVYLAGTATPRPESWAELPRLELPERVDELPMPPVRVLDMRELSGKAGPLHPETRAALSSLAPDAKAIVMLNRRGFSPHLACSSCGHSIGCPHCDVSLVLHRAGGRMSCHHCGHAAPVPTACPECDSVALARFGAGTERIEQIVAELVDPAPVFRLDTDTTSGRGAHAKLLEKFGKAGGGVLVGTQMVAKGHDFGDVVLSVLLDADSTLRYPDFRAEERTFALVSQLAGRSGRSARGGEVLVQTLAPGAAPIAAAARHDAAGFLSGELDRRRQFGYPPFASLIAVELAGADERRLATVAERLAAEVTPALRAEDELLGPAPRFRRRSRFRRRILIKTAQPARVAAAVATAVDGATAGRELAGIALAVDVDPQ